MAKKCPKCNTELQVDSFGGILSVGRAWYQHLHPLALIVNTGIKIFFNEKSKVLKCNVCKGFFTPCPLCEEINNVPIASVRGWLVGCTSCFSCNTKFHY